jgi:hypothetical protein
MDDFGDRLRSAIKQAQDHAIALADLSEDEHRALCKHFDERVVANFREAADDTDGFLRFATRRDANGLARLHSLSIQRDHYTRCVLYFRVDSFHLETWWQLYFGSNNEYALGGWWDVPLLQVEDQDAYIQAKVLDLVRNLREHAGVGRPRYRSMY